MYCNKCGTQLLDNEKYCHNCGNLVTDLVDSSISNKTHKSKLKLVIIFLLIAVIAICVISYYYATVRISTYNKLEAALLNHPDIEDGIIETDDLLIVVEGPAGRTQGYQGKNILFIVYKDEYDISITYIPDDKFRLRYSNWRLEKIGDDVWDQIKSVESETRPGFYDPEQLFDKELYIIERRTQWKTMKNDILDAISVINMFFNDNKIACNMNYLGFPK